MKPGLVNTDSFMRNTNPNNYDCTFLLEYWHNRNSMDGDKKNYKPILLLIFRIDRNSEITFRYDPVPYLEFF